MTDIHTILREDLKELTSPANVIQVAFIAAILIALYLISTVNFLLFHGIVELAGIAVAFSIFIIVWNTRREVTDAFFLIVGISFLFIGSIDLVHALAYKGMGVFPGNSSDLPTQLWIAARYFQSITFLVATLFIGRSITRDRKYDVAIIIAACTAACALLFASIFVWQNFPHCFVEGSGLTPFKIASEYIISLILIATIAILYLKREHFDPTVWKFFIAAQAFLILGELAFTSYISVFGFMNMLGHLFRLLSVYLFYRAFVVVALTRPYDLLLRELKHDEDALRESENKLNTIVRGSPIPQFVIDSSHQVIHWNEALEKYSGIKAEEVIGTNQQWRAFYPFERPCMADLLADGTIEKIPGWYEGKYASSSLVEGAYEGTDFFPHMGPSGIWLHFTAAPIRDIDGRVIGVVETLEDITGRKNAEITIQKLLQFQNSALMNANVLLFVIDLHGIVQIWNKAAESITGYHVGEVVGSNAIWRQLYPEKEYRRQITGKILHIMNDNNFLENLETTVLCRNGDKKIISWNTRAMTDERGVLSGYIAIGLDITDRKRAEEALRASEEKYRLIVENSRDLIYMLNARGEFLYASPSFHTVLGYHPDEITGRSFQALIHPEDLPGLLKVFQRSLEEDYTTRGTEYRVRHASGEWRWHISRGHGVRDTAGNIGYFIGIAYDITDRREAEEALKESEERLRTMIEQSPLSIQVMSPDGRTVQVNHAFEELWGRVLEDLKDYNMLDDEQLTRYGIMSYIRKGFSGEAVAFPPVQYDTRKTLGFGKKRWVQGRIYPVRDVAGIIRNVIVVHEDITERRQAEEALRESEERYRTLVETSFDGIVIHRDGILLYVNRTGARLLGSHDPDMFIGKPVLDFVAPEFRGQVAQRVQRAPERSQELIHEKFLRLDGITIDVDVTTTPITWQGRNAAYVTFRDITEWKRAEEALRQSEERYRVLFDESPISLSEEDFSDIRYWIDTKREEGVQDFRDWFKTHPEDVEFCVRMVNVTRINRATLLLFKAHSKKEFADRFSSIFTPESYDAFREEILALISGKTEFEYEIPVQTLTCEKRIVLLKMIVVPGFEQTLEKVIISLLDITERKLAEDALNQVNRKLTMLNSITRHDILNQLMGLQAFLELSKEDVTDPLIQGYIQKEEQAAKAIEQQIEFTRNYQDIGAQAPKWQIISEIISSAIRQLNPTGIDINVDAADVELFADPLIEKVFYNLMENSLRHGGHVTRMDFFVKEMENGLILTYSDNGVGITAEDKKKLFRKGFGKHTGLGLFLSREILSITGIMIRETGEAGMGVRFEITVPKGAYRFEGRP